jgi:hypothetical protein
MKGAGLAVCFALLTWAAGFANPHVRNLVGNDPKVFIHDYHDSVIAWCKVLAKEQYFLSFQRNLEEFGESISRHNFAKHLWPQTLLLHYFPVSKAELILQSAGVLISVFGILGLAKVLGPRIFSVKAVLLTVATAVGAVSVAYRPQDSPYMGLLYCAWAALFFALKENKKVHFFFVVSFIFNLLAWPFSLGMSGTASFILVILMFSCPGGVVGDRWRMIVVVGMGFFLALAVMCWEQILDFLASGEFQSHRTHFAGHRPALWASVRDLPRLSADPALRTTLFSDLWPLWVLVLLSFAPNKSGAPLTPTVKVRNALLGCLGGLLALSLVLESREVFEVGIFKQLFYYIQFSRLRHAVLPLVVALSLVSGLWLVNRGRMAGMVCLALVLIQVFQWQQNNIRLEETHFKSAASYYSTSSFASIRPLVQPNDPNNRVGCLGIHPALAQYHGLYTVDFYLPNYDLSYKTKFRKIIQEELARESPHFDFRKYFDEWGSRAYLFSVEYGNNFLLPKTKKSKINAGTEQAGRIVSWGFDVNAFKAVGGRYLISVAPLAFPGQLGLDLVGEVPGADSLWDFWVYRAL